MQIKQLGILGGGQLAKMLALAAQSLNIPVTCFESVTVENPCAAEVARVMPVDFAQLSNLPPMDWLTFETENIPVAIAKILAESSCFYPPVQALALTQDRLFEKTLFTELNIPTPQYFNIATLDDLILSLATLKNHAVLKTRTLGYDGKGQCIIKWQGNLDNTVNIAKAAYLSLSHGDRPTPLILESFVEFDYEVSLISVRDQLGHIAYYPLTKNTHQSGILILSEAPFTKANPAEPEDLLKQAQSHAEKMLNKLNYVGVLAIEFFVKNNRLIANEMAPRVHNSGHWTIEGAQTSQFENHIRAVCGLALGPTEAIGFSAMKNIISILPTKEQIIKLTHSPGMYLHLYGKSPKPQRKLGHITLCADSIDKLKKLIFACDAILL